MDKSNIENLNPKERYIETRTIGIEGMTCDKCVQTIERALRGIDGLSEVKVDRSNKTATVTYDNRKTDIPALHDTLLQHGYRPTTMVESS
jgi:copper chaperone